MEDIKKVAIQAVVKQGEGRANIKEAYCGFPEFTSAVTATFHVRVLTKDGGSYEVPVTTRVTYSHPVAIL